MDNRVTKYAKQVLSGNIVAGEKVILACKRHLDDIKKSKKKSYRYKFDEEMADIAFSFFEDILMHTKGEWQGQNFKLELWQCFVVGSIFGWVDKKTGLRRFKTVYTQIAKKNGKSALASGIGLYGLLADGEGGAEIYSAATTRDQARIVFDDAKEMIKKSKWLKKEASVYQKNINVPSTNSKFEPLSADADTLDGKNVHMGILDEIHAHKTRDVWDIIENGTASRRQPLIFGITTAGFNKHGIANELYQYTSKVLDGNLEDDTIFAFITEIDEGDDWEDESCWAKANPNLGISVKLEDLRSKAKKASEIPAAQNNFLCKHLNVWTSQETRWMDMKKWEAQPDDFDIEKLEGLDCIVGMDLSSTTDLTSLNFEFKIGDKSYAVLNHSFMPEESILAAEKRDKVPYRVWADQGYITLTPGEVVDYEWIESYIIEMSKKYVIQEICYDPWNATQIANNLANEGFVMVEVRQGYKTLSEPTKDVNTCVLQKRIYHFNNPVLAWAMSNAVAVSDPAGNIKLDKSKAQFRIDPAIAFVISHVRARMYEVTTSLENHIKSDGYSL